MQNTSTMSHRYTQHISRRRFTQAAASTLLVPISLLLPVSAAEPESIVAETQFGKIRGVRVRESCVFKGVPYARTTTRLAPPSQPETWTVRDALQFGPRAIQGATLTEDMSESCQVLNVWTPACDRRKRPVMVWLHGGGFMNGSANTDLYDGTDLNKEGDVVIVTLNHRLGAFGYLYVASAGKDYASSGCVGMLDIVAALRWVRDNIANFGGDPHNVTIFGESGGGGKVLALMTMPSAKGLFHRAICQSGALLRTAITPEEGAKTTGEILLQMNLTIDQLDQLLQAPADRLLKAQAAVLARAGTPGSGGSAAQRPFSPIIDGHEMPEQPFDPVAPSISAGVPLMIGTNKEETRFFFVATPKLYSLDESELRPRIEGLLGNKTDEALKLYKNTRPGASATDLFFAISTAQMYWFTSIRAAERKSQQQRAPVYMYQFAYEGTQTAGNPPVALKAAHSMEIPFAFAHPRPNAANAIPSHELLLAKQMSHAWIAFARNGNPNHSGLPKWPAYETKRRPTMFFDTVCSVKNDPHEEERRLWERLIAMG
jgi:para-nitrobenzyl esterase